ncbi:hypothetical protein Pelo_16825 [Pelomyxa schiedti]|nr:hypothetical protein Pelo_16825 [Pelomyxa schiedti]
MVISLDITGRIVSPILRKLCKPSSTAVTTIPLGSTHLQEKELRAITVNNVAYSIAHMCELVFQKDTAALCFQMEFNLWSRKKETLTLKTTPYNCCVEVYEPPACCSSHNRCSIEQVRIEFISSYGNAETSSHSKSGQN